ncbi:MAG: LysR family transcriptional regulator [Oscillospiraceae bacterium]|jgi:DNA-binding transcriptional LysR family regulator
MNLHKLYSFTVVAEKRSFARAAEYLNFSQPALSKQISSLEEELGVRLLERDTHSVTLTEAGRVLLEGADKVFRAVAELEDAVIKAGERDPKISVGYAVFHLNILQNFHKFFGEHYPGIFSLTVTYDYKALMSQFFGNKLDIALIRSFEIPGDLFDNNIAFQHIWETRLQFCVHKDHRLAKLESPSIEDLEGYNLIFLAHILDCGGNVQREAAKKAKMRIPARLPSIHEEFMQMLFDDRNVGLYEKDIIQPPGEAYKVFDVPGCEMPFYISAIWKVNNNNSMIHIYNNSIRKYLAEN